MKGQCTHHWFLELVGFYAANEEGLTHTECSHQQLQGAFELAAQCRGTLPGLNTLEQAHARIHAHIHTHIHTPYTVCY